MCCDGFVEYVKYVCILKGNYVSRLVGELRGDKKSPDLRFPESIYGLFGNVSRQFHFKELKHEWTLLLTF